jgi:DNA-binding NtrC family response regulator
MELKGKILAVDDDSNFLTDLESVLSDDFDLTKAQNVSQAMQSLSVRLPDLILLDMNMPEISGLDFLKVLKQKNVPVPVIVLTGESDPETIVTAMRAGATDYIIKGSSDFLTSLSVRISQALTIHGMKKQNELLSSKVKER